MGSGYKIRFAAREGLEYVDENDIYRFGVYMIEDTWRVILPGSKGKHYETHEMSEAERQRILPRIEKHLAAKKYLVFFGRTYPVVYQPEGPVSVEMNESRARAVEFFKRQENEGKLK